MNRSAASRLAAETTRRMEGLKNTRRTQMGTCLLCEATIYANDGTTWLLVEGVSSRVHTHCIPPGSVGTGVDSPEANTATDEQEN